MSHLLPAMASPGALLLFGLALGVLSTPLDRAPQIIPTGRGTKRPRDGPVPGPAWLRQIIGAGQKPPPDALSVAADVSLYAACTRAGLSTVAATNAVADAAGPETTAKWQQVCALLSVGVDPHHAWSAMNDTPGLSELAGIARMSQRSGAAIASGCERIAVTLREDAADGAKAAAERAGVFIALPLAVCFLPGFILLGLAPVVISLGAELIN